MATHTAHEPLIRLGALSSSPAMDCGDALAATAASLRPARRWPHNIGLLLVDVAVLHVVRAEYSDRGWRLPASCTGGVVNALALPSWIAIPLAVVLLDLTIYFQHVMFHPSHALALHRVHHTDLDFDVHTVRVFIRSRF